jgi:hypothetical protein
MPKVLALFGTLAALVLATPVVAWGQAQYNGTYSGVSMKFAGTGGSTSGRGCVEYNAPSPLTVANGTFSVKWGTLGDVKGTVSAQGALAGKNDYGATMQGQIDGQGKITGIIGANCNYNAVWQKR